MKKKPAAKAEPSTGASVIEKEVPTTKIEKTVKVTIKGVEFELTFTEANKLSDEIRKITGAESEGFAERLAEQLRKNRPKDIEPRPYIPHPPYTPPYPRDPYPYQRPTIWY